MPTIRLPAGLPYSQKAQRLYLTDRYGQPLVFDDGRNVDTSAGSNRKRNGWTKRHTSALEKCSLHFNRANYVFVRNHADFNLDTAFTITVRVNPDRLQSGAQYFICKGEASGTNASFRIYVNTALTVFAECIEDDGLGGYTEIQLTGGTADAYSETEIVFRRSGVNYYLRVNGVAVDSAVGSAVNGIRDTTFPIWIGQAAAAGGVTPSTTLGIQGRMAKVIIEDILRSNAYMDGHIGRQLYASEIDANVQAYWPFDDGDGRTVRDRSGNAHTGYLGPGGPGLVPGINTTLPGDKSVEFDGYDDYVECVDLAAYAAVFEAVASTWTVQVTVRPNRLMTGAEVGSIFNYSAAANFVFSIEIVAGAYRVRVSDSVPATATVTSTTAPAVGTAVVLTVTRAANGDVELFVNGVSEATDVVTLGNNGRVLAGPTLKWGMLNSSNYYEGRIDEAIIWNRVLSDAEVTAFSVGYLFDHDESTSRFDNVTGYWRFDKLWTIPAKTVGFVQIDAASATVNGRGTDFDEKDIGKSFTADGDAAAGTISAIVSAVNMTLAAVHGGTYSKWLTHTIYAPRTWETYQDLSANDNPARWTTAYSGPVWAGPIVAGLLAPFAKGLTLWKEGRYGRVDSDMNMVSGKDSVRTLLFLDVGPRCLLETSSGVFQEIRTRGRDLKAADTTIQMPHSSYAQLAGRLFICNGHDPNMVFDGETVRELGIDPPDFPPVIANTPIPENFRNLEFKNWTTSSAAVNWTETRSPAGLGGYIRHAQLTVEEEQNIYDVARIAVYSPATAGQYIQLAQTAFQDISGLGSLNVEVEVLMNIVAPPGDIDARPYVAIILASNGTGAPSVTINPSEMFDPSERNNLIDATTRNSRHTVRGGLTAPADATRLTVTLRVLGGSGANLVANFMKVVVQSTESEVNRRYAVSFINSRWGVESMPSPLSRTLTHVGLGQAVSLTGVPVSTDPQVDKKRIWRNTANGAVLWLDAELDNSETTYSGVTTDTEVGTLRNLVKETVTDIVREYTIRAETTRGFIERNEVVTRERVRVSGVEERHLPVIQNIAARYDRWKPPPAKMCIAFKGYLILAGFQQNPNIALVSVAGDNPEHFDAERSWLSFSDGDGDILTALWESYDQLLFFKNNSLYITSDPYSGLQKVEDVPGPCNHRAIVAARGTPYFLHIGEGGVEIFRLVSNVQAEPLSFSIQEFLATEIDRENTRQHAHAVFHERRNQVWFWLCAAGGDGTPDITLVFDIATQKWLPPYTGLRCWAATAFEENGTQRLIGLMDSGFLAQIDTGNNDGVGVSGPWAGTTAESLTTTLLTDTSEAYPTTGDGLRGSPIRVTNAAGVTQDRIIERNTATTITPTVNFTLTAGPYTYSIGYIDAWVQYPWSAFGSRNMDKFKFLKRFKSHYETQAHAGTITVRSYLNQSATQSDSGTFPMNGTVPFSEIALKLRGRLAQFRIENTQPDQPWEIYDHELEYEVGGVR